MLSGTKGRSPAWGNEAYSYQRQYVEHAHSQDTKASGKRSGWEGEGSLTDVVGQFPYWRTNIDCSLPCPPIECGGCGSKILELRRNLKANWTSNLLKSAEKLTSNSPFPNVDSPIGCSSCLPFVGKVFKNPEVRRAAF
ncbi:hypothetical protein IFM89_034267 [Coptis chinensis]|uniref:Uncharacterized protein n=1 Tax=Coptis chinensis TaxID=261450 RepID=A0A835H933_9MAGN|nr:hypothetical protein IFM89_034267 [Coptis chinensis]